MLCPLLALVKLLRLPLLLFLVLGRLLPTCLPLQRAGEMFSMLNLQQLLDEESKGHCAACANPHGVCQRDSCMHVTTDIVFSTNFFVMLASFVVRDAQKPTTNPFKLHAIVFVPLHPLEFSTCNG